MFHIYLGNKPVGSAQVRQKGLYYEIVCRCHFPDRRKYRIYTQCGDLRMDLGICFPFDGSFGFCTTVKVKSVGRGNMEFFAVAEDDIKFIPVNTEKPFDYLSKLRSCCFSIAGEQMGVIVRE